MDGTIVDELIGSVRSVLAAEWGTEQLQAIAASPGVAAAEKQLWDVATDAGWTELIVPEEEGGLGFGIEAAVRVAEEIGYAAAPIAFAERAVLGVLCGSPGSAVALRAGVEATTSAGGWLLSGRTGLVTGLGSGAVVVAARAGDGLRLFAADLAAEGVTVSKVEVLDLTRDAAVLEFAAAPARALDTAPEAATLLDLGALFAAADATGVARRSLDLTVDYVAQRRQFGRPVGSFQAIKHMLADMHMRVQSARALVEEAARVYDSDGVLGIEFLAAATRARELCASTVGDAIQLHGGIGFTWEHPCHMLFKRAKLDQMSYRRESVMGQRLLDAHRFTAPASTP